MNKKLSLLMAAMISGASFGAFAEGTIHAVEGVKDLNAIKADYLKLGLKSERALDKDRNALQREATGVIKNMTAKSKKISAEQAKAFVELMAIAVPVDPGAAIIENNIDVVKENLPALRAELSKLSKAENYYISQALAAAIDANKP